LKRVFILSRHSLFGQGIETLLSQQAELDIVSRETDLSAAVECIRTSRPDVVIVDCDNPEPDLSSAVMCILQERLGVCVIGLSLRDNRISIYRGEDREVRQVEDLLAAIQG
jgi:DNA-binding NarL/FixJ family response regulator